MRVLGIGNIANNAYKNAVILRKAGIECDVMCPDYFHVMASPEWEECRLEPGSVEEIMPNWAAADLGGYERPRWFAQGSLKTCVEYLLAYRGLSEQQDAEELWSKLQSEQEMRIVADTTLARLIGLLDSELGCKAPPVALALHLSKYLTILDPIKELLAEYDAVIAYAAEGIMPLLAGVPYIAYEHGTIRNMPFDGTLTGALCALVYKQAKHVLVTNPDCAASCGKLGLASHGFVPHPILERREAMMGGGWLRQHLFAVHDADFIVFHPARHHWSSGRDTDWDKGNDILIEGFARFLEKRPKALLICVAWGLTQKSSRERIELLGITDRVVWISPRSIPVMLDYIEACDVLADQFTIGSFGAIVPLGLMLGKPTMCKIYTDVHEPFFSEQVPVMDAHNADEVWSNLCIIDAIRMIGHSQMRLVTLGWFAKYHSETAVLAGLKTALEKLT